MGDSSSFESVRSSASLIGSLEDAIENDRLRATCAAFNDIARAQDLREKICASYPQETENKAILFDPYACMSNLSPWKPIINIVREMKARWLDANGNYNLPPTTIDS